MLAINSESEKGSNLRHQHQFQVGDRVETCNHCFGTIVRVDRDEIGIYVVARLDILPGDFAYDPWDLEKI